jgi:hypothetical protein
LKPRNDAPPQALGYRGARLSRTQRRVVLESGVGTANRVGNVLIKVIWYTTAYVVSLETLELVSDLNAIYVYLAPLVRQVR